MKVEIEVSVGELIDKITILKLKKQKISDSAKLKNILFELEKLTNVRKSLNLPLNIDELEIKLIEINTKLWEIEDLIREKEKNKLFDFEFIELSRGVYINNDKRAVLKRQIDISVGSSILEEKSYGNYI